MKVLMAVDDSQFSEVVWLAMVAQFRPDNTDVRVLHVLQPLSSAAAPQMAHDYAPELDDQKQQAYALVERICQEVRNAGFKVQGAVEVGDIRETIIDDADEWHADLIVVGSHGKRGLQRFLLGSVAESVARHAHCSVQIIRVPLPA